MIDGIALTCGVTDFFVRGEVEYHKRWKPVNKSRPTQNKRARERAKQEKQQQKAARRFEANARKLTRGTSVGGEDPDIAGIVPGPQPSPWGAIDDEKDQEPE